MAVLYKDAMKRFIEEITDACNQHEILYADMVYQDSLFDFQEQFIAALMNAHENGLFTKEQLLKFNYVFGITNEKA